MALERASILRQDYEAVTSFLTSAMHLTVPSAIESHVSRCHRLTYSLCLWRYRLRGLPPHSKVFLNELASDAVQFLPQALTGYSKTTALLTRSICENALRHLYFKDHPIEFRRDNGVVDWHLSIASLFEYALNHPDLQSIEIQQKPIAELKNVYSELSRAVHASKVAHHETRRALADIKLSNDTFKKQAAILERATGATNFLLAILHKPQFHRWPEAEQAIVMRTLPSAYRHAWLAL